MTIRNILIICGGRSPEHEISLLSAVGVAGNLDGDKFRPIGVYVDHFGTWHYVENFVSGGSDLGRATGQICTLIRVHNQVFLFVLESQARYQNNFSTISELYYNMMMSREEDKQHYITSINDRIKHLYSKSSDVTTLISRNITEIKKVLVKEDQSDKYLPIIEGLERISFKFYNKLMSGQFETNEDLEIARQKMISLVSFFNNSVYSLDNLSNFIDYLTYDDWRRSYSMLCISVRIDDYYDKIIRGIGIVEKLVERL